MLEKEALLQAYNHFIIGYSKEVDLSPKTVKNKKDALDDLIPFLDGKPLTLENCISYKNYMVKKGWKKPNSQLNIVKNLRALVTFLFEYEYIDKNFAKRIYRPKVKNQPESLPDIDQTEAAIIAGTEPGNFETPVSRISKKNMRFALQFALRTGVRGEELINIRGKDLFISDRDPNSSKVLLLKAKGGMPQWQPLPLDMLTLLKLHINDEKVFPVSIKTCNIALRRGAKIIHLSSGINMHVHILRKVFITTLSRYLTMAKVCALARHSSIRVTQEFYIIYGLSELGADLNMNHPLIRISLPPEDDIRAFIYKNLRPHFARSRMEIFDKHVPSKKKFLIEIYY